MAAADTLFEVMTIMVKRGPMSLEWEEGREGEEEL